jgi:SAM-dependent methyltransferase
VVGVDVSADMLAVARAVAPDIDWRDGNAGALPLRDGEQFDAVLCQQGLQFFPDKRAAAAEMRRALARGGRLAVSTWRPDEEIPFFFELRKVGERRLGAIADQRYSLGDAGALEKLLRDAGLHDVELHRISRTIRFEDGGIFVRMNAMALVGMSDAGKTMTADERKRAVDALVDESNPVLRSYSDGAGLAFELSTNLAVGRA